MDPFDFMTRNKLIHNKSSSISVEEDNTYKELGNIMHQLINGNINAIFSIMSPIVISDKFGALAELRNIVPKNISKSFSKSLIGMSRSNLKDCNYNHLTTLKDTKGKLIEETREISEVKRIYHKKLNVVARQLEFGINLIKTGEFMFKKVDYEKKEDVEKLLDLFIKTLEGSNLPEISNSKPFLSYLLKWRLWSLKQDGII